MNERAEDGSGTRTLLQPMVGRDTELATAEEALVASLRGESHVVVVSGEAGVGKTRFALELQRRARMVHLEVLFGECPAAPMSLPYLPLVEAIGNHLGGDRRAVTRARRRLGPLTPSLARILPIFAVSAQRDADEPTSLDKLRMFEAVAMLLRDIAAASGLMLVIEDLHWAERATHELLDFVARRLRGTRSVLVLTMREEEFEPRSVLAGTLERRRRTGDAVFIALHPLRRSAVAQMAAAALGGETPSEDVVTALQQRTDGLPLAVEELLRDALHRDAEQPLVAGLQLVAGLRAPQAIAQHVQARLRTLDEPTAQVVRIAAVMGVGVDVEQLACVTERTRADLVDALDACVAAQLIESDAHTSAFRFHHAIIRDAVYDSMTAARRQLLHRHVAERLQRLEPQPVSEIAQHLVAAHEVQAAAPFCAQAAEVALQRLAPQEACALFERALEGTADTLERARLTCRLGEALHAAGDVAGAQRRLVDGVATLERLGDDVCAARHELSLGRCCWERGDIAAARQRYEHARQVLEPHGASADLAAAYLRLAGLDAFAFDAGAAQQLATRALEVSLDARDSAGQIAARDWLGLALCDEGRLDDGVEQLLRSADAAEASAMPLLASRALGHAASVLESYGRVVETEPLLQRMAALTADPWTEVVLPYYRGWRELWNADLISARESAKRCIDLAERFGMDAQAGWGRALLAAVLTELDDVDGATALLPEAHPGGELQVLLEQAWVRIRNRLAAADDVAAHRMAREVAAHAAALAGTALSDTVIEALIAAGDGAAARSVLAAIEAEPRAAMHRGHVLRSRARMQLIDVHPTEAVITLSEARTVFNTNGYRLEALHTDLLVARAHAAAGDHDSARQILEMLLGDLPERALLLQRRAHELASDAGLPVATQRAPQHDDAGAPAPSLVQEHVDLTLRGERMVTVLFADVRDYTRRAHAAAPADIAERIAMLQRAALNGVQRHHGIVDKFAGDAVMATFNAAGAHVEHTRQAVEAALDLIATAAALGLPVGVGIATGPAIVGRLADRANMSVLGEVTNLASRLQAEAHAGEIVMSEEAARRIRHDVPAAVTGLDTCTLTLKGFESPVAASRARTAWTVSATTV